MAGPADCYFDCFGYFDCSGCFAGRPVDWDWAEPDLGQPFADFDCWAVGYLAEYSVVAEYFVAAGHFAVAGYSDCFAVGYSAAAHLVAAG